MDDAEAVALVPTDGLVPENVLAQLKENPRGPICAQRGVQGLIARLVKLADE